MSLRSYGTGECGLAIVGLQETEKCRHTGKPLHHFPLVWKGVPFHAKDRLLTCTLFSLEEEPGDLAARGQEFLELCQKRSIRTIVSIGTAALRAVSPVHGKSTKLIGSTILHKGLSIIPVETPWNGFRVFRSHAWTEAMARFVKRGLGLAEGRGRYFQFPRLVTGDTVEATRALEQILDEKLPVGNDLETTGHDFHTDAITAMGLANRNVAVSVPWETYVSRLYGPQAGLLDDRKRRLVAEILSDEKITKVFHNGMFDLSVLAAKGIEVAGPIEDTLLAHKICYPDLFHNLQFCMSYEFALHPWKTVFEQIRKKRKEPLDDWAETDPGPLMVYNAQDAAAECPLWERLSKRLSETHRGWENYEKLKKLASLAADMQYHGVAIDQDEAEEHRKAAVARIASIRAKWEQLAPGVDPGSSKQINTLFFDDLKAPIISRSKRTDKEQLTSAVLLEYAGSGQSPLDEIAFTLFEYRKIKKSYDAFLKPLTTSRVHAKPQVAGTRGTRFSYSQPNLQQWSKEKTIKHPLTKQEVHLAPNLRNLVCPDPGMALGEHDYNALEARLVAYAANIPIWLDWMARDVDMHVEHVALMFGRRVDKKHELRQITKTLTYARFYNRRKSVGQVLKSLKPSMPDLTEHRLLEVFDRFDKARPEVLAWQEQVELFVKEHGYVELTLSGIRQHHDRRYPDINAALSFGVQSTGGDIINSAALRINGRLSAYPGARILINVHDALVWQSRPEDVAAVADIVRTEMEQPVNLWQHKNIVIPTECKIGPNWRDLKPIDKWKMEYKHSA